MPQVLASTSGLEGKLALQIVLPLAEKRNNILRDGGMVFRREYIPHETF